MPWWGKVLLGCGIACALLGVGAGVLFLGGLWWAFKPGAQIATDTVVTPDAVAVVHLSGEGNLDGLSQLASAFLTEASEQQWRQGREHLPPLLRWLEPIARMQETQAGQGIGIWVPREATVTILQGESGARTVVLAANFRAFVRPVRLLLQRATPHPGRVERRAGGEIVHLQGDAAIAFAGGTLLWASHAPALDRVFQRAASKSRPDRPAFLPAAEYDRWKSAWSLALVADGRDERTRALLAGVLRPDREAVTEDRTIEEPAPSLTYVAAGVRLATADRIEAEVALVVPDAVSASRWQALIDSFLAREATIAAAHGLALVGTTSQTSEGLIAKVHLDGLTASVKRLAAEHSQSRPRPVPTAVPGAEDDEAPASQATRARWRAAARCGLTTAAVSRPTSSNGVPATRR